MVQDRESQNGGSSDKAWTIHAAIIGINTGNLLFRGIELDTTNPEMLTLVSLSILAAALPFQAVFFLINSYIQESTRVHDIEYAMLERLSLICQTVSYLSLIGIAALMFDAHIYIGIAFFTGTLIAIILLRTAMIQAETLSGPHT